MESKKSKSEEAPQREIKELRADVDRLRDDRERAQKNHNELLSRLDEARHELVHFKQTVRSLHFALNVISNEIGRRQLRSKEFVGPPVGE